MPVPSRRACLSVPASSEKMLAKADSLGADELVLDLEDAVAASEKDSARARLVAFLTDARPAGTVSVRVNAPRTPWCHHDLIALASLDEPPRSVVVPKVESPADLAFVDALLDGVEAGRPRDRPPLRVQALIETAAGLAALGDVAGSSPRLETLILGYADLGASLGRTAGGGRLLDLWAPAQHAVLVAARAHGLQAIDGPHLGIAPDEAFRAGAQRAAALGFDGKWAIHPAQVGPLLEAFTPSADEVADARLVLRAIDAAAHADGAGAVALDGQMHDAATRLAAERLLARAGVTA